MAGTRGLSFFISYTAHAEADLKLARYLEEKISDHRHTVFIDTQLKPGVRWSDELERNLESCSCFIVLLSRDSVKRDAVAEEVHRVCERARTGSVVILPVRVRYGGKLPFAMAADLRPYQHISWNGPDDDAIVLAKVLDSSRPAVESREPLQQPGEAVAHLVEGNITLARISAQRAIAANAADAQALYVCGLLELQYPIAELDAESADRAERFLRASADFGLGPQCALPRIALRYDHYRNWQREAPAPALKDLITLYHARNSEAVSWPFGILNDRLPTSPRFKVFWKG
jgi:hypothetical protein